MHLSPRETPTFFFTLFSSDFVIVAETNSRHLVREHGTGKRFIWTAARFFGGHGTADHPHAGDSHVWARCFEFGGLRAGGGFDYFAAFGVDRGPICCSADFRGDRSADYCLFQLSADNCGLSEWRGILYRRSREPRSSGRFAGGRGFDDRLPAEC